MDARRVKAKGNMNEPRAGDVYLWAGKLRIVKKYYEPTNWVYFMDGTSCRLSKMMQPYEINVRH